MIAILRLVAVIFFGYWLACGFCVLTTPKAHGAEATKPCTASDCPKLPATGLAPAALWGVTADGTTDDSAALSAACAFAAGHHVELLLAGAARAAATVTCLGGVHLRGIGFTADNPLDAPGIVCDLSVTPCLSITPSGFGAAFVEKIQIGRAAGTIPAGAIGIEVTGGANAVFEDVISYRHDLCWHFAPPASAQSQLSGYTAHLERGHTFACQDAYFVIDTWPDITIHGLHGGITNYPDFNAKAVIRLTGGPKSCPSGAGPNTVRISDSNILAFNADDGSQAVIDALWQFQNISDPCNLVAIFAFENGHVEEVRHLVTSDATTPAVDLLRFERSTWVGGSTDHGASWIALDPATQILRWRIVDDDIYFWNQEPACFLCLAPNAPIEDLRVRDIGLYGRGYGGQPQTGPVNVQIAAPVGSWGAISGVDLMAGGTLSVTGPGAAGIAVGSNFTP